MKNLVKLVIAVASITIISGCATPVWVFAPDDHRWTTTGDTITTAEGVYTTRYDGVWMRMEVDKVLHDAKWRRP